MISRTISPWSECTSLCGARKRDDCARLMLGRASSPRGSMDGAAMLGAACSGGGFRFDYSCTSIIKIPYCPVVLKKSILPPPKNRCVTATPLYPNIESKAYHTVLIAIPSKPTSSSRVFQGIKKNCNRNPTREATAVHIYVFGAMVEIDDRQCLLSAEAVANQRGAIGNAVFSGRTGVVWRGHLPPPNAGLTIC